jgi:hypothetical protein
MKTTVDISDALLQEARRTARDEGTTLRALVEEGLRAVLSRRARADRYVLADRSVGGEGLQPAVRGAGWSEIRDLAYGDRH